MFKKSSSKIQRSAAAVVSGTPVQTIKTLMDLKVNIRPIPGWVCVFFPPMISV
jgi:hypothetical protein